MLAGSVQLHQRDFIWHKIDFIPFVLNNQPVTWVTIEEIKPDLPAYLQGVEAGETLVVVQSGKPVAEIKPVASDSMTLRPFGLCAGDFIVPDDFDEPLPESVVNDFEGR